MLVRRTQSGDDRALEQFLLGLPRQEGGFLKADVSRSVDREVLMHAGHGARLAAFDDHESIVGFAAVVPSIGRSSHVAELRLVVAAGERRRGIGRELARASLVAALELGLEKLAVEVLASQEDLVDMFVALGFEPEALLHDFVRDEDGNYADLMVLVHPTTAGANDLFLAGIAEALEQR